MNSLNILKICFITTLLLCVNQLFAQQPNEPKMNASSFEWLSQGPYERLGNPLSNPDWGIVDAPVSFVNEASKILLGAPQTWKVQVQKNYRSSGKNIVTLRDKDGREIVCLADEKKWIRLSGNNDFRALNTLTGLRIADDTKDVRELTRSIEEISQLYKGSRRSVMSRSFLGLQKDIGVWLNGSERDADAFRALCHDPIVTHQSGTEKIGCNVVTVKGSVEDWRIYIDLATGLITDIQVSTIRQDGTFSYGYVG